MPPSVQPKGSGRTAAPRGRYRLVGATASKRSAPPTTWANTGGGDGATPGAARHWDRRSTTTAAKRGSLAGATPPKRAMYDPWSSLRPSLSGRPCLPDTR